MAMQSSTVVRSFTWRYDHKYLDIWLDGKYLDGCIARHCHHAAGVHTLASGPCGSVHASVDCHDTWRVCPYYNSHVRSFSCNYFY